MKPTDRNGSEIGKTCKAPESRWTIVADGFKHSSKEPHAQQWNV